GSVGRAVGAALAGSTRQTGSFSMTIRLMRCARRLLPLVVALAAAPAAIAQDNPPAVPGQMPMQPMPMDPMGQMPMDPMGQMPMAQQRMGPPPLGQQSPMGQVPMGPPPIGQQPPMGQPPMGQPPMGQQPGMHPHMQQM